MALAEQHALLRVFVPESAHHHGQPAWRAVIARLHAAGIGGATAYRGRAGFTAGGPIHTDAIETLADDLPVVVEAVDRPEQFARVRDELAAIVGDRGLITREMVEVVRCRGLDSRGTSPAK